MIKTNVNTMKKTLFIIALFAVLMPAGIKAQDPDTIWTTREARQAMWFTPDGTRLIDAIGRCLDVTDGHLIWEHGGYAEGLFTADSQYYYSGTFQKFRISDGKRIGPGVHPEFKEIPDFFKNEENWTEVYRNGDVIMGEDENTFYCIYQQEYKLSMYPDSTLYTRILICKYKRDLDSIVSYTPFVVNATVEPNFDPGLQLIGYSKATNTIIAYYNRRQGSWDRRRVPTFRQISGTSLDSVNEFIYDYGKYSYIQATRFSYNNKYLALGTYGGWILIMDLINNSLYREIKDGYNVSALAFSRQDSFLVVTNGLYDGTRTKIWNYHTGEHIYTYDAYYAGDEGLDVSPDNTMIISPSLAVTTLLRARWTPPTAVEDNEDEKSLYLYPNPAGDYVDVMLSEVKHPVHSVKVYDVLGVCVLTHPLTPSREGETVRIDVSALAAGVYFVVVDNKMYKFVKL
jgi:hypothetical protein